MAKINIAFGGTNYQIDESALAAATAELRTHLSTVMNGTGATIKFGDLSYNIDSTKLTNATNAFVSHLGTISGSGSKVVVNGVEYSVDSTKMATAIADLHTVLGGLHSEGDGSESGSDDALPIEWNSLSVVGNTSVDVGGMLLVKISDKTLSAEEFNGSEMIASSTDVTERLILQEVQVIDGAIMASYTGNSLNAMAVSITTTEEIAELGMAFPETGLYTMDYSQMGDISFIIRECVELPTPDAPEAPTAASVDAHLITLNVIDGCEYSIDGNSWQDDPSFYGLKSETEYTFYARYKPTLTHNASESSSATIRTACITISITTSTREQIGYNDETTELIIPSVYYNDENEACYVTSIGNSAFFGCANLTSVTIPDSVTSIGNNAFYNCTSLASVTIPDSVTSIGSSAFHGCTNLASVTIPNSVTGISDSMFNGCTTLISVAIPNSVTSIGDGAFYNCTNLTSVTIPDSVTSIAGFAFYNCDSLTSVAIPDGVTSIGGHAFYTCENIQNITISNSVENIDADAFNYCRNLTDIVYEGTTEQWNAVVKGTNWNASVPATEVKCSDGAVSLL